MHRLRWRLCKTLRVSVDDAIFGKTNNAQYIWYEMQMTLDEKDRYELYRDMAEYNAMFSNPEGVEKMREARQNTFTTSNEDFESTLKTTFGRGIGNNDSKSEEISLEDLIRNSQRQEKAMPYLNMELDEIKFTPIRGD